MVHWVLLPDTITSIGILCNSRRWNLLQSTTDFIRWSLSLCSFLFIIIVIPYLKSVQSVKFCTFERLLLIELQLRKLQSYQMVFSVRIFFSITTGFSTGFTSTFGFSFVVVITCSADWYFLSLRVIDAVINFLFRVFIVVTN